MTVAATLLSGWTSSGQPPRPSASPLPQGAVVDPLAPEPLPTPVDDFVEQLAERLELPRDTTEARLGELLVTYRDVARARTGQPTLAASDLGLDHEPQAVSVAPS